MTIKEYLISHGINQESVDLFELKAKTGDKISIPVKDEKGEFLFNKYRHLAQKDLDEGRKYSYDKGSKTTLFNTDVIDGNEVIFITEGEIDAIRLSQEGLAAVCSTGGAGTFRKEWEKFFSGKEVYIIYDNDEPGQIGASKVQEVIPHAVNITLPEGFKDVCDYFLEHSFEEFESLIPEPEVKTTITYEELVAVFKKWLIIPDENVIKITLAGYIAHQFRADPVWLLLVAPPSGTKTEILSSASGLPKVQFLSDLTAQTFASGMKAKEDPSLLPKLKDDILIMKDFTTVLNMRREDRGIIYSQLREIYDGHYTKHFGTGKKVEWSGKVGILAGVTPVIDSYSSFSQSMGERFLQYRVKQPTDTEVAVIAMKNTGKEKQMREEIQTAVSAYIRGLIIPKAENVEVSEEMYAALAGVASIVVKARSGTFRDYKKEIELIPEPEAPSRLAKQLVTMLKALAVLMGRTVCTWEDYYLVMKLGLDNIPKNKADHLMALCNHRFPQSTSQVAGKTDYSTNGSKAILEDLVAFGLAQVDKGGQGKAHEWQLSTAMLETYFPLILPEEAIQDSLFDVFKEDDPYRPLIHRITTKVPVSELSATQTSLLEEAEAEADDEYAQSVLTELS